MVTRGLCDGYSFTMIKGVKTKQPEVKARESDIDGHFNKVLHGFSLIFSLFIQWVQTLSRPRAAAYLQNFLHACTLARSFNRRLHIVRRIHEHCLTAQKSRFLIIIEYL